MKVEFFIEAIYYHPENPIPSIIIAVRNNMSSFTPAEPVFADSESNMKDILKDLFIDTIRTHKTTFMIPLDEYRKSGMMVGDRLEIDMTIKNSGEIVN